MGPLAVIVMGVSGSGKSTLGPLVADALDGPFLEGDRYHDAAAVAKMRQGHPLSDEDRWPWLDRLGVAVGLAVAAHGVAVAACSALKHGYRQRLIRAIDAPTCFVLLDQDRSELMRRLSARSGHYMPPSLLDSQLDTLERPGAGECAVTMDAGLPPEILCRMILGWLRTDFPASLKQGEG